MSELQKVRELIKAEKNKVKICIICYFMLLIYKNRNLF